MIVRFKINSYNLGDSYELIKEFPDNSVDCIYTDVPYLYSPSKRSANNNGSISKLANRINRMQGGDLKNIIDGIDYSILNDFVRISKKVNIFIWCSKMQIPEILKFFVEKGYTFEILVWTKVNPTPQTNGTWLPDLEYCLYFRENGVPLNDGYELKSKFYSSPINKRDKDLYNHPTIKPLELVKRHLLHTTQPDDLVVDFFAGSGTTGVAANETGRRYILFDNDPQWHKVGQDRLDGITASGQFSLFNELFAGGDESEV